MPQRQAAGDVSVQATPAVDDRIVDGLEGGEAITDLGHVRPGFGGVVVHTGEDPHPAVAGFVDRYNTSWLIQRHGHLTPKEAYQAAQATAAA